MIWTDDASPEVKICVSPAQGHKKFISAVQNLRFACANHSVGLFSLRKATQNASPEVKICVSPARNAPTPLGRTVFPAQGHTKRVSRGQNLRFACAGAQNRMLRMLRHESETWILQRFLRYIWMPRHGSGDMDLAEDPEIQRC